MPNTIQPREYSKGGGAEDILDTIGTPTATCMSAILTGMVMSGTGTIIGLITIGMTITLPLSPSQVSLLLS